tara:strand:- start:273 stop:536 length:264 start_codon:yes stop_codon:yes gene_type:complete
LNAGLYSDAPFPWQADRKLDDFKLESQGGAAPPSSGHGGDLFSYYHRRAGAANKGDALRQARIGMIDELTARDFKGRIAHAYGHPIF